ncbi:MAG TPA: sulfotransferase [Thermoanaerobaculia bacterium]|jgi:hypothetical protein
MTSLLMRGGKRVLNRTLHWLSRAAPGGNAETIHAAFIIGAPRTGSTVLYQALTNDFRAAYIDNLAAELYGSLPLGMYVSRRKYGDVPHGSFHSVHGSTAGDGGHAPNECGEFWYRWLPRQDHFVEAEALGAGQVRHLRRELARAERVAGAPLVFKNLNAGQRLRVLARACPEARVIWCRRERAYTVQSILAARRRLGWPDDRLWSIRPKEWRALEGLPVVEQVCRQVVALENQIEQDLRLFPAGQVRVIHYEDWVAAPAKVLADLGSWLGLERRPDPPPPEVERNTNVPKDPAEFQLIRETLQRLESA